LVGLALKRDERAT